MANCARPPGPPGTKAGAGGAGESRPPRQEQEAGRGAGDVSIAECLSSIRNPQSTIRNIVFAMCITGVLSVISTSPASAQPNPSWIRVAIVRGDHEVSLQVHGGFTMHGLLTGNTIHQGRRLRKVAVRAVPGGIALGKEIFPIPGFRLEAAWSLH